MSTIFESFNARFLSPRDVARSFVPPDNYDRITRRSHTLIVGPRGSGKTTLLKMLQTPALEAWHHADADRYRARVDYTGVFVPADLVWAEQIKALGTGLDAYTRQLLGVAAFSTHVFKAFTGSVRYRSRPPNEPDLVAYRRLSLSRDEESQLVDFLAEAWDLRVRVRSLAALEFALSERISLVHEIALREETLGQLGRSERIADHRFLHFNFLSKTTAAIDAVAQFEQLGSYALLFDELELAPPSIRTALLTALRSTDQRILFKLSLSPYTSETRQFRESAVAAAEGADFDTVPLWYAKKEEGYAFSHRLLKEILLRRGVNADPRELFGSSEFEPAEDAVRRDGALYRMGSKAANRFKSLERRDPSFRRYLAEHGINTASLDKGGSAQRAATVRKITSLVAVRDAYFSERQKADAQHPRRRSRVGPQLYRGASSVFAMAEGNPRWLIGIVNGLLDKTGNVREFTPYQQRSAVDRAANRFRSQILAISAKTIDGKTTSLIAVLDQVGSFFQAEVVGPEFNPDPVLAFVVDEGVPIQMQQGLEQGLNAGAIVYVPGESGRVVLDSLEQKQFRLSYLLAPHYWLPLRLGRAKSLSQILQRKPGPALPAGGLPQRNLFDSGGAK